MILLAIDVGTSTVKTALLDQESGEPLRPGVRVPYTIDYPESDAAELSADRLWQSVAQSIQKTLEQYDKLPTIGGIGLSCLMPALVLLNRAYQPIRPIWLHLDRRSRPIARLIWEKYGDDFLKECGNRPLPGGISALCYMQQTMADPYLADQIGYYLHANSWLAFQLTGEMAMDPANASFTGLWNTMGDQKWSSKWCDIFGVDVHWLPQVVCGSSTIGTLRSVFAEAWGLPKNIPVKIGTADTSSGMLAAHLTDRDLYITVGTTTVLARLVTNPVPDSARLTRHYGIGNQFIYAAHNPVGGSALPWILDLCFADYVQSGRTNEFYEKVIPQAVHRVTNTQLKPPFLGGDRLEIEAKRAAFTELTLGTDRMDLLAALLDAMRNGHRAAQAALELGNQRIDRIIISGGGSEILRLLVPELENSDSWGSGNSIPRVEFLQDGALRGVARLFDPV